MAESTNKRSTIGEELCKLEKAFNLTPEEMSKLLPLPLPLLEEMKKGFMPYPELEGLIWRALIHFHKELLDLNDSPKQVKNNLRLTIEQAIGATATWEEVSGELHLKSIDR